jgi:hypothetical protein
MTNKKKQSGTLRQSRVPVPESASTRVPGPRTSTQAIRGCRLISTQIDWRKPVYISSFTREELWPPIPREDTLTYDDKERGILSAASRDYVIKTIFMIKNGDDIDERIVLEVCNGAHAHVCALIREMKVSARFDDFADPKDELLHRHYKVLAGLQLCYLKAAPKPDPSSWMALLIKSGEMIATAMHTGLIGPVEAALEVFVRVAWAGDAKHAAAACCEYDFVPEMLAWQLWSLEELCREKEDQMETNKMYTMMNDLQGKILKLTRSILVVEPVVRERRNKILTNIRSILAVEPVLRERRNKQDAEERALDEALKAERLQTQREDVKRRQKAQREMDKMLAAKHAREEACKRVAANAVANVLAAARRAEQARLNEVAEAHAAKVHMVRSLNAAVAPKVEAARAARAAQAAAEERAAAAERARAKKTAPRPRLPEVVPAPAPNHVATARKGVSLPTGPAPQPLAESAPRSAWVVKAPPPPEPPLAAPPPPPPAPPAASAPEPVLSKNDDEMECPFCLEDLKETRNVTALGCGHLYCTRCAHIIPFCAMCRSPISQRLKLYF